MTQTNRKQFDVVVIGAGPAGLATAIAARCEGLSVLLADHSTPPIDKACGEGIMPDGLSALAALGVTIPIERARPFRGIRFLEGGVQVDATFPHGVGLGVRRRTLHEILTQKAMAVGVDLRWGARISDIHNDRVTMDGRDVSCHWVVGADGHASMVREKAGVGRARSAGVRYGFRQHFALRPWTDFVEVYWSELGQIYVTPVSNHEVCVALISSDPHVRLSEIPSAFPELNERLAEAAPSSREQGAITVTRQLDSVFRGNVALVGEASGSVDAITGEGMSLGFQQALELARAMRAGSFLQYETAHRAILKTPRRMAQLMVLLGKSGWLRRHTLRALSSHPDLFAQMLSVHVGESHVADFGLQRAFTLGWSILTA